jgi:branched-subunit amino acid transport protein
MIFLASLRHADVWPGKRTRGRARMLDQRYIRDVAKVGNFQVVGIGFVAGLVTSLFYFIMRKIGWTGLNLEMIWGRLFTGRSDEAAWWTGFLVFLAISSLVALVYSSVFRSARRSGAGIGLSLGFIHWAISGILTGLLPQSLGNSGFFLLNTSFATAWIFMLAHLVYGSTVGALFDRAAVNYEYPRPITT